MIDKFGKLVLYLGMYTVEVEIACDNLGKEGCNIIKKALEPDNKVEGLYIMVKCLDSRIHIEISGGRVNSVRAAYNDLARTLIPLIALIADKEDG